MDYLTEGMISELELKQLRVLRITEDFGSRSIGRNLGWIHWFVNNNGQLKVLDMPNCRVSIEHLQIMFENLSLLKILKLKVDHFNSGFLIVDDPLYSL
jgi:hypothetical protein